MSDDSDVMRGPWWRIGRRTIGLHIQAYKQSVAVELAPHFEPDWSVLDVGCDDGSMAQLIQRQQRTVTFQGVDIQSLRPCKIPRAIYDGQKLPFPDNSFDAVMAVDMLHHTRQIEELVSEMARVARQRVIIKDHLTTGPISWLLVALGDAVTNLPYGIPCAYNFPTLPEWLRCFQRAGLQLAGFQDDLQLSQGCIQRFNPLFRLDKAPADHKSNFSGGRRPRSAFQVVGGAAKIA